MLKTLLATVLLTAVSPALVLAQPSPQPLQQVAPESVAEAQMRVLQQENRAVQAEARLLLLQQQTGALTAQLDNMKRAGTAHPALGDWQQVAAFYADQIRSLRQGKSPQ